MRELADFTIDQTGDGGAVVSFSGPMTVSAVGALDDRLRTVTGPLSRIDMGAVDTIDTFGAWIVWRLAHETGAEVVNTCNDAGRLIRAVGTFAEMPEAVHPGRPGVFERVTFGVGTWVIEYGRGILSMVAFLGSIILATGQVIRHPRRFRGKALVRQFELVGVSALGIVGLMSFLIGIVVAQQGAVQLRQFGAEIYTINLVGRITLRELGVLMTAIMVAGRSGSAFAAQIGTMKLTEEVDAMRTIGLSPIEVLVLPRVLAAVLMMPLLGFYASLLGIIGGAVISHFELGIPFFTFLSRIREVVPIHDLWVGLVKAPVFGLIVAMTGCYQGMRVKSNAEEVGMRTTDAVVQAIFMVIVLDAFFAVLFSNVGWG